MKRIVSVLLLVLFLFGFTTVANAEGKSVEIPDMNLSSVTLPDGWLVFTKPVDANDPNLTVLNTDKETLEAQMDYSYYLLYAYNPGDKSEISISSSIEDNGANANIFDLKQFNEMVKKYNKNGKLKSDEVIEKLKTGFEQTPSAMEYTDYSVYETSQATFLCLKGNLSLNGVDSKAVEYYTVNNGNIISVLLRSSTDITADQEALMKGIVDSMNFSKTDPIPDDVVKAYERKVYTSLYYFSPSGFLTAFGISVLFFLLFTAVILMTNSFLNTTAATVISLIDGAVMSLGMLIIQNTVNLKIGVSLWYLLLWLVASVGFIAFHRNRNMKAEDKAYEQALSQYNEQKKKESAPVKG